MGWVSYLMYLFARTKPHTKQSFVSMFKQKQIAHIGFNPCVNAPSKINQDIIGSVNEYKNV